MTLTVTVDVPPRDREVLASWVRSMAIRAGLAQRARIVLLAAEGLGTGEIVARTGLSKPTVIAWPAPQQRGSAGPRLTAIAQAGQQAKHRDAHPGRITRRE